MRTTVNLNDALLKRAKHRAAENGETLGSLVEDALRHYLSTTVSPRQDVALPAFDGGADGGLRAGVDPSSNRALYEALDDGASRA